jgi:hypothetical protein
MAGKVVSRARMEAELKGGYQRFTHMISDIHRRATTGTENAE